MDSTSEFGPDANCSINSNGVNDHHDSRNVNHDDQCLRNAGNRMRDGETGRLTLVD